MGLNQFDVKVANRAGSSQTYWEWHVPPSSVAHVSGTGTPPPTAPASTTTNSFRQNMFGIDTGSILQNESDTPLMARDLSNDRTAGARWIRIDINWAQIQDAGAGSYYWTAIDAAVRQAQADGLQVLGTIVYTPSWARPRGTNATYGPDPSLYSSFAAAAVAHYSALGVHNYEIWNEENNSASWMSPNPSAYTTLLKAAYPAIKHADPSATVIVGGLSPAATDGTNFAPPDFLAAVYAHGGQGAFDAVGMHPYCWPAYPGDAEDSSAWYQMYGTSTSLRSLMVGHGDGSKKIWGTEFGAPTNGPSGASIVSPGAQAAMITRAYQLWSTYSWAGPLFVFEGRDEGTNVSTTENFFGLSNADFSPKPAYAAYQAAVATLG